jgi:hypothetical protein
MSYFPVKLTSRPRTGEVTTLMAKKGVDLRDAPQLLSPDFAQKIVNYIITGDGGLLRRPGLEAVHIIAGSNGITLADEYTSDILILGYADKIVAYSFSADTVTTIKTYTTNSTYSGDRYGDYFFVSNNKDALVRISRTLAFDAQTANFTLGKIITGATSGATAIILEQTDAGATGVLTLGSISGTFVDNEIITDNNGTPGSATVNGTVGWTTTDVTNAPIGAVVRANSGRLFIGRLSTDQTGVAYSSQDTGSNPPFNGVWTVGANATDPGLVYYRNAGAVQDIVFLGANVVVFSDFGKWAFQISVLDSGGTIKKTDITIIDRTDLGGAKGITTPKGIFYVNEGGLWQIVSLGQPNIPFSEQESLNSVLLGSKFFDDIDLSQADLVYSPKYQCIFITCANDAEVNNFVIGYNLEYKAFFTFTGWNLNRFLYSNSQNKIYGFGANSNIIFECFSGWDDNGNDVWYQYRQELKTGDLETRQVLYSQYIQGFLSASGEIEIRFDIYDVEGNFVPNKRVLNWTSSGSTSVSDGYGIASWGTSAWGGDVDVTGLLECFAGGKYKIANYQRIILDLNGHDKLPHALTWVKLGAQPKAKIRRRNLTQTI